MPVSGLDHVNIRTMDVAASAAFYVDILGFEYRHDTMVMGNRVNWLFDTSGRPIIHFRVMEAGTEETGPIDHVALACQGRAEMTAKLKARNIPFQLVENITPGFSLMFVKDPHGVSLELRFEDE